MGSKSDKKCKLLIFPRDPTSFDEYLVGIDENIFFPFI